MESNTKQSNGKKVAPNLIGITFGRLTVESRCGSSKHNKALWMCVCECGNIVITSTGDLNSGHTQSCGCYRNEQTSKASKTHDMSQTHIYTTWASIKKRCLNPNSNSYKDYGGRGITVCSEWEYSFESFYEYVSKLPHYGEEGYSLDRINNNGNYEPGNVRWATWKEQANNRRKRERKDFKNGS